MPNIGTTRGDVAYLVDVLVPGFRATITDKLARSKATGWTSDRHRARVRIADAHGPPLPNFSWFHPAFKPDGSMTAGG